MESIRSSPLQVESCWSFVFVWSVSSLEWAWAAVVQCLEGLTRLHGLHFEQAQKALCCCRFGMLPQYMAAVSMNVITAWYFMPANPCKKQVLQVSHVRQCVHLG